MSCFDANALRVTGEALGFGECDGVGADVAEAGVGVVLNGDDLDEVEDAERPPRMRPLRPVGRTWLGPEM